jgi:hypothetical protein
MLTVSIGPLGVCNRRGLHSKRREKVFMEDWFPLFGCCSCSQTAQNQEPSSQGARPRAASLRLARGSSWIRRSRFFRRERGDDFLEAWIAAQRVPVLVKT